jgi:hypothetical protein
MSDQAGPEGMMMRGVVDLFAEYERGLIRSRTKAALDAKRVRGEAVGKPPYGYQIGARGVLEPAEDEQRIVAMVARLRSSDMTEREIAEMLNLCGFRSRAAAPFSPTQVHRILGRIGPWLEHPNRRLIRRRVLPTKDIEIDVDLYGAIVPFEEQRAKARNIEPLLDAVENGKVELKALLIRRFFQKGWREEARKRAFRYSGKENHQWLCAMASLFLEARGKRSLHEGKGLSYSAGIADVAASDGSVFVECGSIREDKILEAMRGGDTVLFLPYWQGGYLSREAREALADRVELAELLAEMSGRPPLRVGNCPPVAAEDIEKALRWKVEYDIIVGYLFVPNVRLPPDPEYSPQAMAKFAEEAIGKMVP